MPIRFGWTARTILAPAALRYLAMTQAKPLESPTPVTSARLSLKLMGIMALFLCLTGKARGYIRDAEPSPVNCRAGKAALPWGQIEKANGADPVGLFEFWFLCDVAQFRQIFSIALSAVSPVSSSGLTSKK